MNGTPWYQTCWTAIAAAAVLVACASSLIGARSSKEDETPGIIDHMQTAEAENALLLKSLFPQGHVVFTVTPSNRVIPLKESPDAELQFDWDTPHSVNLTPEWVWLTLPKLKSAVANYSDAFVLARAIGAKGVASIGSSERRLVCEIIATNQDGVIVALGRQH